MKSDIAISYILSKSLFFGFIMSFILNNSSYLSFISILIGYFLGYILLKIYMNKNHKINNIILPIIDILLLVYLLFNLSYQASYFFLGKTPTIFIILLFLIVLIYGSTKKLDGLSNLSLLLLPINTILIIMGITFNIDNYNIINANDINTIYIIINIFVTLITSVTPLIIYLNTNNKYNKKHILIGYLLSGLTITIISINTIFCIGPTLLDYYSFPEYMAYKKIHILNFIERIENIVSIYSLIDFTILGIVILLNIRNLFNNRHKIL